MSKKNIIGLKTKDKQLMNLLTIEENNINIIIDKQNNIEINTSNDYTAFEVYPTDHDIPRGSSELGEVIWNDPAITTNFKVVASMTEEFSLWITKSRLESDIVIDWGDGTIEKLSELTPTSGTANDGQVDVLVYVAHTYEIPNKRYIVKVYGNDYCRLSHNGTKLNSANRLLCRCFTDDLPVSHHLNNLGSFAYSSNRLVKVDIPSYSDLFTHIVNWSSTFNACYNLRYCYGFGNMFQSVYSIDNILNGCGGLLDTDIKMRSMLFNGTSASFNGCTNLERNVLDFFGSQLNVGTSPFTVQRLFTNCAKIHLGVTNADYEAELEKFNNGEENTLAAMKVTMDANAIKLGNLLWNNKNIVWNQLASDGKTGPFSGCSAILKSYVPTSWGGTNASIDAQLAITDEMKDDYTAWEVMCRWETIYGEFSNGSYLGDLNEKTGYKYKKGLPYTASTGEGFTEKFILRTTTLQENQDVIVDWGDGTFSNVKNGDFESVSSSGFDYTMSHTYTQPTEFDKDVLDSNTTNKYRKTKRYIIKIYGKQYYGFRYTNIEPYNLMCRCLDWDLPVASHFTNFASFCYGAKGLQVVAVPEYTTYLKNAINFSSMFDGPEPNNCGNLISVTGFGKNDNDINYACNFMFNNCTNLIECDFILPNLNTGSMANVYNNCGSLNVDINSLIPKQGFLHKEINVENLFNSTAISGTVPANLLWNDSDITWKNTSNTFSNCSDEIRAQVPISWGGTASDDDIIIKNQSYTAGAGIEITEDNKINIKASSFSTTETVAGAQSPWLTYWRSLAIDGQETSVNFVTSVNYPVIGAGEDFWITPTGVGAFGNGDFADYRISIPKTNENSIQISGAGIPTLNGIYNLEDEAATGFNRKWIRYSFIEMSVSYDTEQEIWVISVDKGNSAVVKFNGTSAIDPWDCTWTLAQYFQPNVGETNALPTVKKYEGGNYVTKTEFEETIGNINSILDEINGEEL